MPSRETRSASKSRQVFRYPGSHAVIHSSSFIKEFSERGKLLWNSNLAFD
jgi:hypothetical protein